MAEQEYSRDEVAKHSKPDDAWLIVYGEVYDVTKFAGMHPGGELLLLEYAGQDATEVFFEMHRTEVLEKFGPKLKIGKVRGETLEPLQTLGDISKVPYAESSAFRGFHSPYYKESHLHFRKEVRAFMHKHVRPESDEGELTNERPSKELVKLCGHEGYFAAMLGKGPALKLVPKLPGNISPEEFDGFHELILHEEFARIMAPGFQDGLVAGCGISVPAMLAFGNDRMKEVARQVLLGEEYSCLAITEAFAGSDVANIRTTATKTADGRHYIVNGTKKWISQGMQSRYFVTAVRTGGPGAGGISMLLIERGPGVETKLIKTAYATSAGTAYVTFENVMVPVENLMHEENQGFFAVMANFNHERLIICAVLIGRSRFITEECFKWANQRKVFGKPLITQPVIQQYLAEMVARVEALQNWIENIVYQMDNMDYFEQTAKLGGDIALLKYECANVAQVVADHAVQIFGGRGITKSGMGKYIERFQTTYKLPSVYGGSTEIMASLGVRQALKSFPRNSKL